MSLIKMPRILYFIKGAVPTAAAAADAMKYGTNVVFRDATKVGEEMLEACEGVAGEIPKKYNDAIADVKSGIKHADDVLTAFTAKMGGLFHKGATTSALEISQLTDKITSDVRAKLAAQYDTALSAAKATYEATITDITAKASDLQNKLDAALSDVTAGKMQIASLEAQLAAALQPAAAPQQAAPEAPQSQPDNSGAAPAIIVPPANETGWTANVEPPKPTA